MEISTRVVVPILILISFISNDVGFGNAEKENNGISKRTANRQPATHTAGSDPMLITTRPQCLQNEHGPNCTYCIPRDTCEEGHFTCDVNTGNKICLPGYQGQNCEISKELASSFHDVACPENTCRNGGSCASGHCCCREGFTGILCEIEIIECKKNSCLNGGICKDLIGKFECLCKPSFKGKNCEIANNAHVQTTPSRDSSCQSKSCLNNATCLEDTFLTYCLCPTFYTGDSCETYVGSSSLSQNTCPENYYGSGCSTFCKPQDDCFGHHVCDKSNGGKICISGWHGKSCDTRKLPQRIDPECPDHGCKNDGQCFNKGCCCKHNYTGENCQIESIGCLSSPCKNNATCTNKGNGFTCECLQSFTGRTCESKIAPSTVQPNITSKNDIQILSYIFTSSSLDLFNTQISSKYTDFISSACPSSTSSSRASTATHKSSIASSFTEMFTSIHIASIYSHLSNYDTVKSESPFSVTESPIPSVSPFLEIKPSTTVLPLLSGSITQKETSSIYNQVSPSLISQKEPDMTGISFSSSSIPQKEPSSTYVQLSSSHSPHNKHLLTSIPVSSPIPQKEPSSVSILLTPSSVLQKEISMSNFLLPLSAVVHVNSISRYSDIFLSKEMSIMTSSDVLTSAWSENTGILASGSHFESLSFMRIPTFSTTVLSISRVHISSFATSPSFSHHSNLNIPSPSLSGSLPVQPTVTVSELLPVDATAGDSTTLHLFSSQSTPQSLSNSLLNFSTVSASFNMIQSSIISSYSDASTPITSASALHSVYSTKSYSKIHPNLSLDIPMSSYDIFTRNANITSTFNTDGILPKHASTLLTSSSQIIKPTTNTEMSTHTNTITQVSSNRLSSLKHTTHVPTSSMTSSVEFARTTSKNIKPSETITLSTSTFEISRKLSESEFLSVMESAMPTLSETIETIPSPDKLTRSESDNLYSKISVETDTQTKMGMTSNDMFDSQSITPVTRTDSSPYINLTSTSFVPTSSSSAINNIFTSEVTNKSSNSSTHSSSSSSSKNIVNPSTKDIAKITILPTTEIGSFSTRTTTTIKSNFSKTVTAEPTNIRPTGVSSIINTIVSKPKINSTIVTGSSHISIETSPLTFASAPSSSSNTAAMLGSTLVYHAMPSQLVKDLNTNSDEGISKNWRIALIVIACVLFIIAIVCLSVFLSLRQRKKDSRIIRQSPEEIQDYSKEHFSEQPDFHNPTYEIESDSDDDSVKYDIYVVNE